MSVSNWPSWSPALTPVSCNIEGLGNIGVSAFHTPVNPQVIARLGVWPARAFTPPRAVCAGAVPGTGSGPTEKTMNGFDGYEPIGTGSNPEKKSLKRGLTSP